MKLLSERDNRHLLNQHLVAGIIFVSIIAVLEYFARLNTDDPQEFIPLFIRANIMAILIITSIVLFDILTKRWFRKKTFLLGVLARTFSYTIIITFWLAIVNGIWAIIHDGYSLLEGIVDYVTDESYLVNLLSVLIFLTIIIGFRQINSLHRKGELLGFVLGKYHKPKEINRIFCFIDLKGSTTIGEKLGHYQFGLFLKDYYSDITDAIRQSEAEIYQYVGDEVILTWPTEVCALSIAALQRLKKKHVQSALATLPPPR